MFYQSAWRPLPADGQHLRAHLLLNVVSKVTMGGDHLELAVCYGVHSPSELEEGTVHSGRVNVVGPEGVTGLNVRSEVSHAGGNDRLSVSDGRS